MDDSLEISRLKGQVEAYQEQLRSVSIEVLRMQVQRLKEANARVEKSILASQVEAGKWRAEFDERLRKASLLFVELRKEVSELRQSLESTETT